MFLTSPFIDQAFALKIPDNERYGDISPTTSDERSYNPVESSFFGVDFSWAAEVKMPDAFIRSVLVLTTLVVIAFPSWSRAQANTAPVGPAQPAPADTPERRQAL